MESNHKFLAKEISLCKKRRKDLTKALERRCALAKRQLKFNRCHQEVAEAIKAFIEEQNPSPSETPEARGELVESSIMENVDDGGLITRRQENNDVPERRDVSQFLKALEEVEKQFCKSHESGKDVSKKLETDSIGIKLAASSLPSKLVRSLSRSSSRVGCSTFYGSEIMGETLGALRRWEEKLYHELKTIKKAEPKRQKPKDSSSENHPNSETEMKIMSNVKCKVAKRAADYDYEEITRLRKECLLPKLGEQLDGLAGNWKAMSEFHESQKKIMSQVRESPNHPLLCEDNHQQATKKLKARLCNWLDCFKSYVSLQKKYTESLCWWLFHNDKPIILGDNDGDWLINLKNLESNTKEVTTEMKRFQKHVAALLGQQGKEHDQKREVKRLESRLEIKKRMINPANEKQTLEEIEKLKERIERTKETHQSKMQETQQKVNQFQTGFSAVFEKLADFSRKADEIYTELIKHLPKTHLDTQT
ncbi:nitrate regulatory gene2 protein-like [Rosa chinensis]|uniref:nitrate regulatory gene2 protein-like n=1 Tax=Rosa chinensis TaxID=74649 RepID=UPI000D08D359|nr:nitrate regulatory gene2 protein-like [Rosa chinensis]